MNKIEHAARVDRLNKALKARFGNHCSTSDGLHLTIYDRKGGVFLGRDFPNIETFEKFVGIREDNTK